MTVVKQPHNTESLRALLKRLHPNIDMDTAVDELMRGHASPRALPEMSVSQLSAQLPVRTAELVHLIPGIARSMLRNNYPAHPTIGCLKDACGFLRSHYLGLRYEHCHLLLLRKNRRVISEQMIQSGTINSLPFYPRNIVEAVLAAEADAIVISHNHPGGTAAPSNADVESTRALIDALSPLSIPLLDHVIIANDSALSIRETEYIEESVWLSQPNNCPQLLKNWLQALPRRKK